jgi:hypothetical protein
MGIAAFVATSPTGGQAPRNGLPRAEANENDIRWSNSVRPDIILSAIAAPTQPFDLNQNHKCGGKVDVNDGKQ